MNISRTIDVRLPAELVTVLRQAAGLAVKRKLALYMVGGVVRDLLLERVSCDIDLVVEGDAIGLARELAGITGGQLLTHERFNTAKIKSDKWVIDIAACRSETYARPGALPTVAAGSLRDDMGRRDFTINAMAVKLTPPDYGELVDLFGGLADLKQKYIRVLHDRSFIDDATRIWRAVRYEQRLNFKIENHTQAPMLRDIGYLETISGDRIRHELELVMAEEYPEKMLQRADGLGVLGKLNPSLHGDAWLGRMFDRARQETAIGKAIGQLYFGILFSRLREADVEKVIAYLKLPRRLADIARDVLKVKTVAGRLKRENEKPSRIYALLSPYSLTAITVNKIVTENEVVSLHLKTYLNTLHKVKPVLTGRNLAAMGMVAGPQMQEVLDLLRNARLDGVVENREQEEKLVRAWQVKHR